MQTPRKTSNDASTLAQIKATQAHYGIHGGDPLSVHNRMAGVAALLQVWLDMPLTHVLEPTDDKKAA